MHGMDTFTDAEERDALRDGAHALRIHADLISNRTDKAEPPDVAAVISRVRRNAEVLEEMASCYEVTA